MGPQDDERDETDIERRDELTEDVDPEPRTSERD